MAAEAQCSGATRPGLPDLQPERGLPTPPDNERSAPDADRDEPHAGACSNRALGMAAPGLPDPRVDAYVEGLPGWQQSICQEIRTLIHEAEPAIEETIKRTVQPYFVLDGNVAALLAAHDHVNVFLYDPLVPDPERIITAGHENATARQIAIREGERINAPAFTAMIREIAAHNRAGGWRRVASRVR
jgi:hypothetical protein